MVHEMHTLKSIRKNASKASRDDTPREADDTRAYVKTVLYPELRIQFGVQEGSFVNLSNIF